MIELCDWPFDTTVSHCMYSFFRKPISTAYWLLLHVIINYSHSLFYSFLVIQIAPTETNSRIALHAHCGRLCLVKSGILSKIPWILYNQEAFKMTERFYSVWMLYPHSGDTALLITFLHNKSWSRVSMLGWRS